MTPDLSVLDKNRKSLLLAEMAAWLHDMGKCSDEMIERMASDIPASPAFQSNDEYKTAFSNLLNGNDHTIDLLNETVTFKDLIEKGRPGAIKAKDIPLLIKYLGRCHAASHIEKERQADKKQTVNDTRLSSPFGYETEPLTGITEKLKSLPFDEINNRKRFLEELKKVFKNAPGDTERPINEVDLWDWSGIVAALYKSALAGTLLGNVEPGPNCLKWRLLAIRIDSERILGDTSKIPALLARKKWISEGLDCVKKLLEEEYPLGNEVYRDENGSVFTVPDISDLLKFQDDGKSLEDLISEKLGYEGEIVVTPSISEPWWGQDPHRDPKNDKVPPIGDILKEKLYSPPNPERVKEWWSGVTNSEICTISWLRPQGSIGTTRKASDYWAERVRGRSEEWYRDRSKTIWIDEVADENDRICLITGKLDISEWLKPDGHVKTLFVKTPNGNPDSAVPKTPSFARLRRIWETSKEFWEEVEQNFEEYTGNVENRLIIEADYSHLQDNSVYELEINKTRASVFYSHGQFIIIENLERLARKMGCKKEQDHVHFIQEGLNGKEVKFFNTEGIERNKHICQIKISGVKTTADSFTPVIPILSEPSVFMAIVPANKAMNIIRSIKKKYETDFGKVRNRLPITVGLTFAKSHAPLMALMDSGRRMVSTSLKEETWILNADSKECDGKSILDFQNGISWEIPIKMGDGTTPDDWYPYCYVDGNPTGRNKIFPDPRGSLVHVSELKKDDAIKIVQSMFDFEFLDSASRRFEISYDENGKRQDNTKANRPYLIDELDVFERVWKIISNNLATTQIKNIISLIETKREDWDASKDDETFCRFVREVLHNTNWKKGIPSNIDALVEMAVSGELRDIIEFYMDIMKVTEEKIMNQEEVSL